MAADGKWNINAIPAGNLNLFLGTIVVYTPELHKNLPLYDLFFSKCLYLQPKMDISNN
jgi:hypothetical protein